MEKCVLFSHPFSRACSVMTNRMQCQVVPLWVLEPRPAGAAQFAPHFLEHCHDKNPVYPKWRMRGKQTLQLTARTNCQTHGWGHCISCSPMLLCMDATGNRRETALLSQSDGKLYIIAPSNHYILGSFVKYKIFARCKTKMKNSRSI